MWLLIPFPQYLHLRWPFGSVVVLCYEGTKPSQPPIVYPLNVFGWGVGAVTPSCHHKQAINHSCVPVLQCCAKRGFSPFVYGRLMEGASVEAPERADATLPRAVEAAPPEAIEASSLICRLL